MKTTLFVLLAVLSVVAQAKDNKPFRSVPAALTAADFKPQVKASDKPPAPRAPRMTLTPIPAEKLGKFAVARRN